MHPIDNDIKTFQILLKDFYDGSASPEASRKLYALANRLAKADPGVIPSELLPDIEILSLLNEAFSNASEALADSTPAWLEQSLDSHIHSLAMAERKRFVSLSSKKWWQIGAAAAVVGIVMGLGWSLTFTRESTFPIAQESTKATIMIAAAPAASSSISEMPSAPHQQTPRKSERKRYRIDNPPLIGTSENSVGSNLSEISEKSESSKISEKSETSEISEISEKSNLASLPESQHQLVIVPKIDPSNQLKMPISALSAGVDNVYRSFSILSQSLALVAAAPLQADPENIEESIPTQAI